MAKETLLKIDPTQVSPGDIMRITSKPHPGVTPERVVTIYLDQETWFAKAARATERIRTDQKISKNGSRYGEIRFASPLRFDLNGTLQPFELKIPDELQRRVDSGEIELCIYIDMRKPVILAQDFKEKIVKNKRKERSKLSATSRVWKKGVK